MPIQLKLSNDLKNLLNDKSNKSLIPKVREQFSKRSPAKIKRVILKDMNRGISPVQGAGKWKKYSQSYKDAIRGETSYRDPVSGEFIIFRYVNGRPQKIAVPSKKLGRPTKVQLDASPTKKVSPVNLRLSGGLHKSFSVKTTGGFLKAFRLVASFKSRLADIHNKRGAGKSKVKRRLLPTESGENFNRNISSFIFSELEDATNRVVKEINGQ